MVTRAPALITVSHADVFFPRRTITLANSDSCAFLPAPLSHSHPSTLPPRGGAVKRLAIRSILLADAERSRSARPFSFRRASALADAQDDDDDDDDDDDAMRREGVRGCHVMW